MVMASRTNGALHPNHSSKTNTRSKNNSGSYKSFLLLLVLIEVTLSQPIDTGKTLSNSQVAPKELPVPESEQLDQVSETADPQKGDFVKAINSRWAHSSSLNLKVDTSKCLKIVCEGEKFRTRGFISSSACYKLSFEQSTTLVQLVLLMSGYHKCWVSYCTSDSVVFTLKIQENSANKLVFLFVLATCLT